MKTVNLQRMRVKDGILYYEDGSEVALWGVNYLVASSHHYVNLKELNLDFKKVIDKDFEHFSKMRMDVIRVQVFDREISDRKGNLKDNEHLDILDYLVCKCHQAGIYLFATAINWFSTMEFTKEVDQKYVFWWLEDLSDMGFSNFYSKEAMLWHDDALKAQENYLRQFVGHKNRYSGLCYGQDPAICVLEIINEPIYRIYQEMKEGIKRGSQSWFANERENSILKGKWESWLRDTNHIDTEDNYRLFRYEIIKNYLDRMISAMKSAGARQPIAFCSWQHPFSGKTDEGIREAIADSHADIVSSTKFTPDWSSEHGNILPLLDEMEQAEAVSDEKLKNKAKIIYEFEDAKNLNSALFPAFARLFRRYNVQIAAYFLYVPAPIAEYNTGWVRYLLNFLYTPRKTIGFMIAREAFHNIRRSERFSCPEDNQRFGHFAVSFAADLALMNADETYMHSNAISSDMFSEFQKPLSRVGKIVGYGNSPLVRYEGRGIYVIRIEDDNMEVEVFPDAVMLTSDPWHTDPYRTWCQHRYMDIRNTAPIARLEAKNHKMRIRVPGWGAARAWSIENGVEREIPCADMTIEVTPGKYILEKG